MPPKFLSRDWLLFKQALIRFGSWSASECHHWLFFFLTIGGATLCSPGSTMCVINWRCIELLLKQSADLIYILLGGVKRSDKDQTLLILTQTEEKIEPHMLSGIRTPSNPGHQAVIWEHQIYCVSLLVTLQFNSIQLSSTSGVFLSAGQLGKFSSSLTEFLLWNIQVEMMRLKGLIEIYIDSTAARQPDTPTQERLPLPT